MIKGGWIIVFITASNYEEAKKIAEGIVKEKLGACVNIVDKIHSIYWWQGRVEEGNESLLIIKTRLDKFGKLVEYVKEKHSYEVPEIVAIPLIIGFAKYLDWLDEVVNSSK
ncbi:CutA1 divalent ion tolerance protein [Staphylothermus marinus F1]|uniref:CutA1 divalent ion tolerance protein n=1 Tax=Staphylothermus marinus (strain ATCC 43588 / DSM 3639 / JCM 9404 / F1) TaxID=399550 RepID=A3DLT2_STAMF|nr:divalent-cation tolerance protein CutA [Staphylothermus marinus]ABN69592.1 CutA1 divalent ion tolerance protein [Staphylothermus marinus F1]